MRNRKIDIPVIAVLVLAAVVIALWISNNSRLDSLIEDPKPGDIYILHDGELYFPMLIESVRENEVSFYQYLFSFGEAVPDREQILEEEWSYNLLATYERRELQSMYESGKIIEIYRDE